SKSISCHIAFVGILCHKMGPSTNGILHCLITLVSGRIHPANQIEQSLLSGRYEVGYGLVVFLLRISRQLCQCIGHDGGFGSSCRQLCLHSTCYQEEKEDGYELYFFHFSDSNKMCCYHSPVAFIRCSTVHGWADQLDG